MNDSRARILSRIRKALKTNGPLLEQQAAAYQPPHPRGPFVAADLAVLEQFRAELTALHGHVHLCHGPAEAQEQLFALLQAHGASKALCWAQDELPLPGLLERLSERGVELVDSQVPAEARLSGLDAAAEATAGITGVDAAVAESGTLLVVSGAGRGRLASLLPPLHIALVPAERIVRSLPEALDRLNQRFGAGLFHDRSNLVCITGPSRTGDIELSLTLGVHGPSEIHVIVVCDSESGAEEERTSA